MDRIAEYLMDNVSNLSSARNIASTLSGNKDTINHKTVASYIQYLCNAFAFYRVRRYDIRGKKYLTTNDKYYLKDVFSSARKKTQAMPGSPPDRRSRRDRKGRQEAGFSDSCKKALFQYQGHQEGLFSLPSEVDSHLFFIEPYDPPGTETFVP